MLNISRLVVCTWSKAGGWEERLLCCLPLCSVVALPCSPLLLLLLTSSLPWPPGSPNTAEATSTTSTNLLPTILYHWGSLALRRTVDDWLSRHHPGIWKSSCLGWVPRSTGWAPGVSPGGRRERGNTRAAAAPLLLCCCSNFALLLLLPCPHHHQLLSCSALNQIAWRRRTEKRGTEDRRGSREKNWERCSNSVLLHPLATCYLHRKQPIWKDCRRTWESQEGQGQKAGSKAKLGRGVMLPCYICPGSLIPIHAHYSSAGPQILAFGPPGQGQKSTEQIFGSAPVLVTKGGGLWMLPPSAHRYRHQCTLVTHPFNRQNQHTYKMPFRNVHWTTFRRIRFKGEWQAKLVQAPQISWALVLLPREDSTH